MLVFAALLSQPPSDEMFVRLRQAESIGRPLGDDAFMTQLECQSGRLLRPAKRGPKPKNRDIPINDN